MPRFPAAGEAGLPPGRPEHRSMAQIFHRSTNTIARVSIYGAVFLLAIAGYVADAINAPPTSPK